MICPSRARKVVVGSQIVRGLTPLATSGRPSGAFGTDSKTSQLVSRDVPGPIQKGHTNPADAYSSAQPVNPVRFWLPVSPTVLLTTLRHRETDMGQKLMGDFGLGEITKARAPLRTSD